LWFLFSANHHASVEAAQQQVLLLLQAIKAMRDGVAAAAPASAPEWVSGAPDGCAVVLPA
jgi:hypothetical protein